MYNKKCLLSDDAVRGMNMQEGLQQMISATFQIWQHSTW